MSEKGDIYALLARPRPGRLFVFAGPSGAGKTTVCRALLDDVPGTAFSISHTTRPRRNDEVEGRDYFFIAEGDFAELVRRNGFVEHAEVHGYHYGTAREQLEGHIAAGRDVLLDIDVQGASQIREKFPAATLVFLLPPSLADLRARLTARGQDEPAEIERRLAQAAAELSAAEGFDYVIINDRLAAAAAAARHIILAERQRIPKRVETR